MGRDGGGVSTLTRRVACGGTMLPGIRLVVNIGTGKGRKRGERGGTYKRMLILYLTMLLSIFSKLNTAVVTTVICEPNEWSQD